MMSSISKIHFNSTTGVSLNDRFTVISKISPLDKGPGPERNGGGGGILRKRSNSVDSYGSRGSYANRQLVNQLDRRHIGQSQAALRLRNKPIRSGRQRLNRSSFASRTQLRRAAGNTLSLAGGSRRMQRSNSFSDVATMNADFVERQSLRRSNSQQNIASRLGSGGRTRGGPRRPLQRTNSSANLAGRSRSRGQSRSRGESRSRGQSRSRSRSRSRTRLPRTQSRGNLTRTRSRSAGLNGIGYNNNNNYNNNIESRLGRGGRMRGRPNGRRGRGGGPASLARSASRTNLRSGSVNGRLGGNRTNRPLGTRGGRGRVAKRGQRRGLTGSGQNGTGGGRPGRTLQRRGGAGGAPPAGGARRGRSRSRGRAISQNRGRSAQRGRNASKGRRASAPTMSKEQLDNELDQYMANTKSSLDKEMDEYMNGIHSSI